MGHFGAAGAPEVAGQSPLDTWSLNEELGFGVPYFNSFLGTCYLKGTIKKQSLYSILFSPWLLESSGKEREPSFSWPEGCTSRFVEEEIHKLTYFTWSCSVFSFACVGLASLVGRRLTFEFATFTLDFLGSSPFGRKLLEIKFA